MPRSALRLKAESTAAESSKKKRRVANPDDAPPDPAIQADLPRGLIEWSSSDVTDYNAKLAIHVKVALMHLMGNLGPNTDEIGFLCKDSGPIALRDFKANELMLFPYSRVVNPEKPESGIYIHVEVTVGSSAPQVFNLSAPDKVAKKKGTQVVNPFWNAARAKESTTTEFVDLQYLKQ